MQQLKVLTVLVAALAVGLAFPDYTGYSGAPGSRGFCAGDCHGSSGGTITVSGFPSTYTAGQTYTVTVEHDGGSTIANFNASVRIGTGSQTAGTLTAGTNTAIYSATGEPMGVHFSANYQSSGTFDWTAPSPAVGPVKLYLAGHQGLAGGPNTEVTMIAQGAGISEAGAAEPRRAALRIEPTVVANRLVLCISNPSSPARLRITDRTGRVVYRLALTASAESHVVSWSVAGLAAGTYLATLDCAGEHIARKFTVR